jgi:alpha-ribazole phosphatase
MLSKKILTNQQKGFFLMNPTYLTLLRHGLCAGETEGRYIGHTDAELTAEGRAQLLELRDSLGYPAADAVFTSPLQRCAQTAGLIYPGQKTIVLPGLQEYFFGEFENKTPAELERHPIFARWIAGEPGLTPPFGEALEAFQSRIAECFIKLCDGLLQTNTSSAAVVTHGGVIMALLAQFGLPEAPMHEWLTPGGTGYTLRVEPSVWLRGHKCEVFAMVPDEPLRDELAEERKLWMELESTQLV